MDVVQEPVEFVDACAAPGVVIARAASITLLALLTGVPACDIIELRLGDVDWRTGMISIVQHKTGSPIRLPISELVTARHAVYVLTERPDARDDHVFLRRVAPISRLSDHASIHVVTTAVFTAAGVTGVKGGTRLLRHTAASRLLRAATPLPAISAVLVHAHEDSTSVYLSVDDALRAPFPSRSTVMSGYGFTAVFAAEPEDFLAFKQAMGFTSKSRIWYLKRFAAYCTRHQATVFDRVTVEGWVTEQLKRSGNHRLWFPYIRASGRLLSVHSDPDAYVLSTAWKAPFVRPHPYLLSKEQVDLLFTIAAHVRADSAWRWQSVAVFTLMHTRGIRTGEAPTLGREDVDRPRRSPNTKPTNLKGPSLGATYRLP